MEIRTFKQVIPYLFKTGITPMVWGYHGIGKSEIIKQIAEKEGYRHFNLRLGQMGDAGDLLGLGELKKNAKGETVSTKFFTPNWLHEIVQYCIDNPKSGAIIFLDEINRAARKDILQATFELCLDKKLHELVLPSNCYVIAAANPDTEDYNVLNFDDKAFISRFCHINLKPSKKEWVEYARETAHHSEVIDFILEQPDQLETDLTSFNIDDFVKPCRRSWSAVSRLMNLNVPTDNLRPLLQGLVGLTSTIAFLKFMDRDDKPISAEEILKSYTKHQKKVKNWSNPEKTRLDILSVCCENLQAYLEKREEKLKKTEEKNLCSFILDVPAETAFSTLQKIYLFDNCRPCLEASQEILESMAKAKGVDLSKLKDDTVTTGNTTATESK